MFAWLVPKKHPLTVRHKQSRQLHQYSHLRMQGRKRWNKWTITVVLLLATGLYQFGAGLGIYLKARLAQYLISSSWQAALLDHQPHRPWPWADTYPVARLTLHNQDWYVLAGANGRNLAFGPTHLSSTSLPGESGHSVIVGHRDTQFNDLKYLQTGDLVSIENHRGISHYRVSALRIAKASDLRFWQTDSDDLSHSSLTLITCYPFDSIMPNPSHRYLVFATQVAPEAGDKTLVSL